MSEEERGGVRLDLCGVCFGVWLDCGELEALHAGGGSTGLGGLPSCDERYEPTGGSAHVRCPRCQRDILRTGRIAKHDVMRCTSCRGIFVPDINSRFKTSKNTILDAAFGVLEEIVGSIF